MYNCQISWHNWLATWRIFINVGIQRECLKQLWCLKHKYFTFISSIIRQLSVLTKYKCYNEVLVWYFIPAKWSYCNWVDNCGRESPIENWKTQLQQQQHQPSLQQSPGHNCLKSIISYHYHLTRFKFNINSINSIFYIVVTSKKKSLFNIYRHYPN